MPILPEDEKPAGVPEQTAPKNLSPQDPVPKEPAPDTPLVDRPLEDSEVSAAPPENPALRPADAAEAVIGGTSPTRWWLYGLVGLAIVIAFLLMLQIFSGAPGTDVVEGTPTSEPVGEQLDQAQPPVPGG